MAETVMHMNPIRSESCGLKRACVRAFSVLVHVAACMCICVHSCAYLIVVEHSDADQCVRVLVCVRAGERV